MLKKLKVLAGVTVFLIPTMGAAQDMPQPEVGRTQGGGDVQYQKETVYDFEGDDVTGSLVKPDGENITGQTHGKTSSLIKIRSDFIPEMLESVEDL
ncbi:hypothetical protein FIV42_04225 [Persicimonas caeni]|uniref:Uncharacterized protein n=1 Tax=Persicimonas caeni TaxID=2292766 RepID=A0A4Y6PP36_PERCE|nr:hypothetical protein [Persicimonas caeni]QDG49973.1 hypothetical protein FIV42_04225 [Persicimonas caeni]QED31194.1 hypothetical protein FRD00_04220 [Persicimonas caeni]